MGCSGACSGRREHSIHFLDFVKYARSGLVVGRSGKNGKVMIPPSALEVVLWWLGLQAFRAVMDNARGL